MNRSHTHAVAALLPLLQNAISRLAAAAVVILALGAAVSASAAEVYFGESNTHLTPDTPSIQGRLPVLFVHGHNADSAQDADFNYRKNWQDESRPSFKHAIGLNSELGIEPYYIRFVDQNRSITDDAREIGEAVELILHRHDPSYPAQPTNVQIVIIAYSKGTISTRQYLKSLREPVTGLPPPRPDFRPVSEFIAIAPPNHGISTRLFAATDSLAVKQLYNGSRPEVGLVLAAALGVSRSRCSDSFDIQEATNYISTLNGHSIADSVSIDANESYPEEAPGSRRDGMPTGSGTLYVTLFAGGNADFVGGGTPSTDCPQPDGRRLARNLSPDAINISVAEITDDGWQNITQVLGFPSDAERRSLAVHGNSVYTPAVICQALYTAVHHRSPSNQTCGLSDSGLPIIPPPARAAAMLALDFSGSMRLPACPGCPNTRADVLKEAVELFIRLWQAVSVPSDRLGAAYFRTNVTGASGEALPLLSAGNLFINDINLQGPRDSTAMGGGLQRAIETLRNPSVAAEIRRVILFTDGMQNVNPMVRSVGDQLLIDNEPGRPNSNVSPAAPPTALDSSLGIAVDTIGLGAGEAFVGLLNDIATRTGGRTWLTTEPNDELRRFFVEELINALRGFSPQLVAYRRGAVAAGGSTESFPVEDGVRKLVLKVSWKRGDSVDFSVAKDGVDVTSAGRFIGGEFYKIFVIELPAGGRIGARGNWQLRINSRAGMPYEAAAIVDGGRITYDAAFGGGQPRAGGPLDLIVRLTAGRRPFVGNIRATAILTGPAAAAGDIIAATRPKELPIFEPGTTLAERRLLALAQDSERRIAPKPIRQKVVLQTNDKGELRAQFLPHVPGIYTALVTIDGDDGNGQFSRTMTATVVVRFAAATLKAGDISVSGCDVVGGRRYVRLLLSPRDARGQRMGPGLASAISVQLSAGRTVGGIHDLGDGRYMLSLALAPGDDPTIDLKVSGGELFSGRLSQLSGKSRR